MKEITVTDATTNPKDFKALVLDTDGDKVKAAVFVTDSDNGFGWPVGCQISDWLNPLGDGKYGAS